MVMSLKKFHQVVIIGAGPVGGVLATALAKSPYIESILLIERDKPNKYEFLQIPNQRVYSINTASYKVWQSLDLTKNLFHNRIGNINKIQVWNDEALVNFQQNNMSRVIENNNILNCIQTQLSKSEKVTTLFQEELQNYKSLNKELQIKLKSGQQTRSKLLVGSDGNKSKVKQLSKIKTYGWSYNQMAIVCTLQLDSPIETAFQQYYDKNVLAVLPLWNKYASIVWSVEFPLYQFLMKKKQDQFLEELKKTFNQSVKSPYNLPKIVSIQNKRMAFPLSSLQSERYISNRIALIGDAAHSLHPMAGLGVNSGFGDAALLANSIILNKKCGNDIGEEIALKNYEIEAKKLNYTNSIAMQSIKKMFEIKYPILNCLREYSLNIVNDSQFLKDKFIESAKESIFFPKKFEWEE